MGDKLWGNVVSPWFWGSEFALFWEYCRLPHLQNVFAAAVWVLRYGSVNFFHPFSLIFNSIFPSWTNCVTVRWSRLINIEISNLILFSDSKLVISAFSELVSIFPRTIMKNKKFPTNTFGSAQNTQICIIHWKNNFKNILLYWYCSCNRKKLFLSTRKFLMKYKAE